MAIDLALAALPPGSELRVNAERALNSIAFDMMELLAEKMAGATGVTRAPSPDLASHDCVLAEGAGLRFCIQCGKDMP